MPLTKVQEKFSKWHTELPPLCAIYRTASEKRRYPRIPVQMTLKVKVHGRSSAVFCNARIVNISRGGMCLEWTGCATCGGYLTGKIHPECIFSPYDLHADKSYNLMFTVKTPAGEILAFRGKAVYVYRYHEEEQVGIAFTDMPEDVFDKLAAIVMAGCPQYPDY